MDQVRHTTLVAQATSEIAAKMKSFVDFVTEREKSRAEAIDIGAQFGLSAEDALRGHDDLFEYMQAEVAADCDRKAAIEIATAVNQASLESEIHRIRLARLQGEYEALLERIGEPESTPKCGKEEFDLLIKASNDAILKAAKRFYENILAQVQQRHRLELRFCFTGHLVTEATARQLADLYEVKPA